MLDGIKFEETGKPAVVIATTSFVKLANSIKRSMNLENLPLISVAHPLGDQEIAASKAQTVVEEIVKAVTG